MISDGRTLDFDKRLDALAWSAIMDSYNSALRKAYEEEKKSRQVCWVTSEDEKVCETICGPMDGVVFDIKEAEMLLPAHVFCRCVWAPVA